MKLISQINKILPYFKKPSDINVFNNILVVSNTGLGDTLLSTPAIISLRRSFPDIQITFLINKKMFPLFNGLDFVNDFILYSSGFINQLTIVKEIRKREIDTIFLFHSNGPEDIFFSVLSRARNILKMTDNKNHDFHNLFINPPNSLLQHDIEKKLDLVRLLNPTNIVKEMFIPNHFYNMNGIIKKDPNYTYIGIQMGAQEAYKMWPVENFINLVDKLNMNFKYIKFVLLGSTNNENKIADRFERSIEIKDSVINLCGQSNIQELPIILNDLDLILTNDTGTLHLSIAMGKDTVSIFGPTNPDEFGPYQDLDKHKVLSIDNSKFVKDRSKDFKRLNKINGISLDMVYKVIEEWLEN